MKKELLLKKNLDLLDEFMKYAFDHPEVLDQVPHDASLVILPEGDASLKRENRKTAEEVKSQW